MFSLGWYLLLCFSFFGFRGFKRDVFFASRQNEQAVSFSICAQSISTPEAILHYSVTLVTVVIYRIIRRHIMYHLLVASPTLIP